TSRQHCLSTTAKKTGDTAYPGAVPMGRTGIGYPIPAPGTANLRTYGRMRPQRFHCAMGVSLFERFLLNGRRRVAGEIRREFRFRPRPRLQLAALNVFGNLPATESIQSQRKGAVDSALPPTVQLSAPPFLCS